MGRVPKTEKIKQNDETNSKANSNYSIVKYIDESTSSLASKYMSREINAITILEKCSYLDTFKIDPSLYFNKEFKHWLNSQLELSNTFN